jgi:hypothetical protein
MLTSQEKDKSIQICNSSGNIIIIIIEAPSVI